MTSGKHKQSKKSSRKVSLTNPNLIPLGGSNKVKKKKKNIPKTKNVKSNNGESTADLILLKNASASQQFNFFLHQFQSSNDLKLSSLEIEAIKDSCFVELSKSLDQDACSLSNHLKATFGKSWKEILCEGQPLEGKIDPGCPAVLVISTSALRSLELFRSLQPLTRECRAAKLFAKHMKVEEQVYLLKSRVNIACGTPSRIKKLVEMDALGLSRLSMIVLDMHTDAKGYSLFTLPQVSGEFWDLYKSYFHQKLLQNDLRICLYGTIPGNSDKNAVPDK